MAAVPRLRFSICGVALSLAACATIPVPHPVMRAQPAVREPYVEGLIARARVLGLAGHAQWLRLLHYRKQPLGDGFLGPGYQSEADGADFFLSPRGKTDPRAELEATISAFFEPLSRHEAQPPRPARPSERGPNLHPLCRFPARFTFLQRELGFDPARLPVTRCPLLEQFLQELNAQSATLIFSSYYLNNPASAFGHTFLRLNKATPMATAERRELLDYGIDFSADVDTGNAVIYAFKGLTGLFPGTFKRVPFFYKVRAYNDYESRDLWEYDLDLKPDQLLMLTAHLWELGHTYFDYYYLSENCSYHILSLFEVANPRLELISRLVSPVIPADTVKALYANPGLVREVHYRPSLRKQFAARVQGLSERERELVEVLAADAGAALPADLGDERTIAVLDAAADLVDVLHAQDLIHKTNSQAARDKQQILERRAQIARPSQPVLVATPRDDAPEYGHGSHRVALGMATAERRFAPLFDLRLALHDLADMTPGYPELSAIEFLRARLAVWPEGRLELQDASFVRIDSLTAQNRFDRKMSWQFDVGATTVADRACRRCLAAQIAGGSGMAFAFANEALTVFIMADGAVLWSPAMEGLRGSHVRLGIGPGGGVRLRLHPRLLALVTGRWLWLPAQTPLSTYRVEGVLRWQYVNGFAAGIEGRLVPNGFEGQLLSFLYF